MAFNQQSADFCLPFFDSVTLNRLKPSKMGKRPRGGFKGHRRDQGKTWQQPQDETEAFKNLNIKGKNSDSSESETDTSDEEIDVEVPFQVAMWDVGQVRYIF